MAGLLDYGAFGTGSPAETAQQPSGLANLLSGAYNAMGLLAKRALGNSANAVGTGTYNPAPVMESALTAMSGAMPLAANVSKAGEVALGVVPVDAARAFGIKPQVQDAGILQSAVKNTPTAAIDDGMLRLRVARQQNPDQEMMDSVRGGVFYLPEGSKDMRYYKAGGTTPGNYYGGTQAISGETAFANPLVVKGATGGKAPEAAYNQLMGDKKAYETMRSDALEAVNSGWMARHGVQQVEMVDRFLAKHAPELRDQAQWILDSSKRGNQLAYALQEAAVASAARKAGHDGVVGYSMSRKTKEPNISEVFDVRERSYPSPSGDFDVWPLSEFGKR